MFKYPVIESTRSVIAIWLVLVSEVFLLYAKVRSAQNGGGLNVIALRSG